MPEYLRQSWNRREEARQRGEATLKRALRKQHDLCWSADRIPRNMMAARKLGGRTTANGMCCLVMDDETQRITVAGTRDPAASVNLEYLSYALQIRRSEGRECLFSLDLLDPAGASSVQTKRFEPAWLAGTSVGDVLLQADVYLKEVSMGEHPQPTIGMRSCLDLCCEEAEDAWTAREWFVVKKAEIRLSQDGVLMPHVEMGVEAREQVLGPHGMQDAAVTRPDHPLVRYAEEFTHNFALIAERRSVVFHLRELARASCLARFLLDSQAPLREEWFGLAGGARAPCALEVPQMWTTRVHGTIHEDGSLDTRTQRVSGGVDLSLDGFDLGTPRMAPCIRPPRARGGRDVKAPEAAGSVCLSTTRTSRKVGRRVRAAAAAGPQDGAPAQRLAAGRLCRGPLRAVSTRAAR